MAAGVVGAGELYRFTAHGHASGQDVITGLDYAVNVLAPVVTQMELANELVASFRMAYLPSVVNDYQVTTYELLRYFDVSGTTPENLTITFSDQILLAGTGADVGGVVFAPMPTYVTATARKITGGAPTTFYWPSGSPVIVGPERVFNGRIAVGPIAEAATQDAEPNLLDTAFRDTLNIDLDSLESIAVVGAAGTVTMFLVVTSRAKAGAIRSDVAGADFLGVQRVNNLYPNSHVGSQLSRKFTGPR